VLTVATVQASVTHDTPPGRFSARAVALMSHFSLYETVGFNDLPAYLVEHLPEEDRQFNGCYAPWSGRQVRSEKGKPVSLTNVQAVLHLLIKKPSLKEIMELLIEWGGDTDSVAAIAWGVASARYQDEELPAFFDRDLEGGNEKTGAPYLKELGKALMRKYA
jgi:ADP-ribosyl-[dinitrogen reductase] hydrolase